jgi:hypothetical protein
MSYGRIAFIAALVVVFALPLGAQSEPTIDPGMTREQVVERLGKPLNERKTGNSWFMFYRNGCERSCGMNDLVILEDDKVVDAIFRSPTRHYSVASTSPTGVRPERTTGDASGVSAVDRVRKAGRGGLVIANPSGQPANAGRATVTGVEVTGAPAQPAAEPSGTSGGATGTRAAGGGSGGGVNFGGTAGGNAAQVTAPGGNSPQTGSPDAASAPARTNAQRPIIPVPLPGAKINPADSVRALTPDRPTAMPGAKVNPADSVRAEAIRRQQADTTRKPD